MKTLFTSAFLCLAVTAFAQDTKKDTATTNDYGARIYDARILRYMSSDPKASEQNNPYNFAENKLLVVDTVATKQPTTKPKQKITAK